MVGQGLTDSCVARCDYLVPSETEVGSRRQRENDRMADIGARRGQPTRGFGAFAGLQEEMIPDAYGGDGRADDTNYGRFTQAAFVSFSNTMEGRFEGLNGEPEVAMRVAMQAMLGARVCGATLKRWIDKDCVFPFGVVVFKPYMMYEMGTAVLTVAGESTGKTFIGHSDFQLTDNVVRIVLHISYYFTCNLSVCKMRKLTVVLWPAMCFCLQIQKMYVPQEGQ